MAVAVKKAKRKAAEPPAELEIVEEMWDGMRIERVASRDLVYFNLLRPGRVPWLLVTVMNERSGWRIYPNSGPLPLLEALVTSRALVMATELAQERGEKP
jgi:hypothetical protein